MKKIILIVMILLFTVGTMTACSLNNYSIEINDFSFAYGDSHIACCNYTIKNLTSKDYVFMVTFRVYKKDAETLVDSELVSPFLSGKESRTYDVYFTSDYYDFYNTYVSIHSVTEVRMYA